MKAIGIVVAKEHSSRFPNKNIHNVNGVPLFWNAVNVLLESQFIEDVFVATNSEYIRNYCLMHDVSIVWRGQNISDDNQPLFEVVKYTYQSLENKYDVVVNIMANSLNFSAKDVDNAVNVLLKNDLQEVRSFNENGIENGLIVMTHKYIQSKNEISTYIGSVQTSAKEIHIEKDLL